MNVKDAEAIKHATAIKEYCCGRINCQGCVFGETDGSCDLGNDLGKNLPVDWELPTMKTYKEDFLEKFPEAHFEPEYICRLHIYPHSGTHPSCNDGNCELCWNKVFSEGGK